MGRAPLSLAEGVDNGGILRGSEKPPRQLTKEGTVLHLEIARLRVLIGSLTAVVLLVEAYNVLWL